MVPIEPRMVNIFWARSPISFEYMSFGRPFLESHETTYHTKICVCLRLETELDLPSLGHYDTGPVKLYLVASTIGGAWAVHESIFWLWKEIVYLGWIVEIVVACRVYIVLRNFSQTLRNYSLTLFA